MTSLSDIDPKWIPNRSHIDPKSIPIRAQSEAKTIADRTERGSPKREKRTKVFLLNTEKE